MTCNSHGTLKVLAIICLEYICIYSYMHGRIAKCKRLYTWSKHSYSYSGGVAGQNVYPRKSSQEMM